MPRRAITDGASYKFTGIPSEVPAPTAEDPTATKVEYQPIGADANALFPGQVVTVRETVPANEPGAHDNTEDAVVIEWPMPSLVRGDNGWDQGEVVRAMSIGVEQFTQQFEEA